MLMTAIVVIAGCKPEDDPNNGGGNNGGGNYNGHSYVDMGLPSGTLWATCNVGANASEEYGNYFAWGETTSKTTYNWNTYKYYSCGEDFMLTKYCNLSDYGYNGFTDGLTTLLPEDDAAAVNWGEGWCMPTAEQWKELKDNTVCAWATQNGVNGYLFTATNGVSLFLPAAGGFGIEGLLYAGHTVNYWSSTLFTGRPSDAWYFYFSSAGNVGDTDRIFGFPVRPVRSAR